MYDCQNYSVYFRSDGEDDGEFMKGGFPDVNSALDFVLAHAMAQAKADQAAE